MTSRHFVWEFLCPACFEEWETDWAVGADVTCPACGATYEAIWETNATGNIIGPWLGKRLTDEQATESERAP